MGKETESLSREMEGYSKVYQHPLLVTEGFPILQEPPLVQVNPSVLLCIRFERQLLRYHVFGKIRSVDIPVVTVACNCRYEHLFDSNGKDDFNE